VPARAGSLFKTSTALHGWLGATFPRSARQSASVQPCQCASTPSCSQAVILACWCVGVQLRQHTAAEVIEALGGEKCGGGARSYSVEFLAPENAQVEARGKAMIGGKETQTHRVCLSMTSHALMDGAASVRRRGRPTN
jgi:hypothetical protein